MVDKVKAEVEALKRIAEFHETGKRITFYTWNPHWDEKLEKYVARSNFVVCLNLWDATSNRRGYTIFQGECESEYIRGDRTRDWAYTLKLPVGITIPVIEASK